MRVTKKVIYVEVPYNPMGTFVEHNHIQYMDAYKQIVGNHEVALILGEKLKVFYTNGRIFIFEGHAAHSLFYVGNIYELKPTEDIEPLWLYEDLMEVYNSWIDYPHVLFFKDESAIVRSDTYEENEIPGTVPAAAYLFACECIKKLKEREAEIEEEDDDDE